MRRQHITSATTSTGCFSKEVTGIPSGERYYDEKRLKMKSPLLSICIATYNRADFIGETLDSIIRQLTDEVEIVVVDGASTDATRTEMSAMPPAAPVFATSDSRRREGSIRISARRSNAPVESTAGCFPTTTCSSRGQFAVYSANCGTATAF